MGSFLSVVLCGISGSFDMTHRQLWASLVAQLVKNLPAMRETWIRSLGWEDLLEKGPAIYPLQYTVLENSLDCRVHRVTKSQT